MSKHRNPTPQVKTPAIVPELPIIPPIEAVQRKPRAIEEFRHCPICWNGNGGYGDCYSKQGRTRYYKCVQTTKPDGPGPCGHTWTALVKLEVIRIEHRVVTLDGER